MHGRVRPPRPGACAHQLPWGAQQCCVGRGAFDHLLLQPAPYHMVHMTSTDLCECHRFPALVPHFPAPMAQLADMHQLGESRRPFKSRFRSVRTHRETICVQCLLHPRSQPTATCRARPPSSEHAALTGGVAFQAHALLIRHLAGVVPSYIDLVVRQLLQVIIVVAVHRLKLSHMLPRVIWCTSGAAQGQGERRRGCVVGQSARWREGGDKEVRATCFNAGRT